MKPVSFLGCNVKRAAYVAALAVGIVMAPAHAQPLAGPPANPQFKFSTPMPPDVAAPAQVESRLGALRFDSGVPDQATTDKLTLFCLYGPLESWFDKTWRPGEIELQP